MLSPEFLAGHVVWNSRQQIRPARESYNPTMNMKHRNLVTGPALVALLFPLAALAQVPLLTPWGDPDLQGIWDRRTITPLERPEQFADQEFLTEEQVAAYEQRGRERDDGRPPDAPRAGISVHAPEDLDYGSLVLSTRQTALIVDPPDGQIPPLTEAARARRARERAEAASHGDADSWLDRSLFERCIARGIPEGMLPGPYNNNTQIIQTPDNVLIHNEMIHETRVIPLDDRPHLPSTIKQWLGDSRGYWDGNTLVVETTNFSDKMSFRGARENLQVVERFTRADPETLMYEFTVTDPTTWIRPWTVSFPMRRTEGPVYEYACHEGNHALRNILSTARYLEQQDNN